MEEELHQLKSVLRSLVVSSPTQVDVVSLWRDYRNMVGAHIPISKYGYKDATTFLREKFSDCFLFQGPASNPVLTLIVPDALKHVDNFVQKQKVSSTSKHKGKRRSVPESIINKQNPDLVVNTFNSQKHVLRNKQSIKNVIDNSHLNDKPVQQHPPVYNDTAQVVVKKETNVHTDNASGCSQNALQNFYKKRLLHYIESDRTDDDKDSIKDDDSGRLISSSTASSSKKTQLEEVKKKIRDLIMERSEGVWCTDLLRLYRERYGCELNYSRFGYTSVLSLAGGVADVAAVRHPIRGDWLLADARRPAPRPPPAPTRAPSRVAPLISPPADADDALPGIDFEADVFPADCMHYLESIPGATLGDVGAGSLLEVAVGEVYSPSHFWLLRLGPEHNIAMENAMDDMNRYYSSGEGAERALAPGAVRVGHYCSSRYGGDWHRSLIVRVLDGDTVKVRHVDYGTVETRSVRELRPLRREWAALPAQAVRARLAGVRPTAAGRRWPRASAAYFLDLVRDRRLVASVAALDPQDRALEVFLVDTSTEEDRCVGEAMVRAGHADPRSDSALVASECYLFPRFDALENGLTPNFAEIHAYLRDGIALDCVDEYRRHVPPGLPPGLPPAPVAPASKAGGAAAFEDGAPPTGSAATAAASVSLCAREVEVFMALSRVRPAAAYHFMWETLRRALPPPTAPPHPPLDPEAPEIRMRPPPARRAD